jgi:hypothetical protein
MTACFSPRHITVAVLAFTCVFLTVSIAHAQDAKVSSPTDIAVRSETATPIRVILPSLWSEKPSGLKSDVTVAAPPHR